MLESKFARSQDHRPIVAGHRGFKGSYPENTFAAYKGAIEAGATVIETDIQVSGDGVVVIHHDPSSLRCFGVHHDIKSTPYNGVLDQLKTTGPLSEPMPKFVDLAKALALSPEYSNIQLILDVKRNNEPWVISKVVEILREVNPDMKGFWAKKMVLGIWRTDVLKAAIKDAPELPVVFIGISRSMASWFMKHEQVVGISLHYVALSVPGGAAIIKEARQKGRLVYAWTVNSPKVMKWAVTADVDGVITDYPDRFAKLLNGISEDEIKSVYSGNPLKFISYTDLFVWYPLMFFLGQFYFLLARLTEFIFPGRKKV